MGGQPRRAHLSCQPKKPGQAQARVANSRSYVSTCKVSGMRIPLLVAALLLTGCPGEEPSGKLPQAELSLESGDSTAKRGPKEKETPPAGASADPREDAIRVRVRQYADGLIAAGWDAKAVRESEAQIARVEVESARMDIEFDPAVLPLHFETGLNPPGAQGGAEKFAVYKAAAGRGDVASMNEVGRRYAHGTGVQKDYAEAVRWLREAALAGDTDAMCLLGICYQRGGHGIKQDQAKYVYWYRKAAEAGDADAMFAVGVFYHLGDGVKKDKAEAARWWRKAAEAGNSDAKDALEQMPQ